MQKPLGVCPCFDSRGFAISYSSQLLLSSVVLLLAILPVTDGQVVEFKFSNHVVDGTAQPLLIDVEVFREVNDALPHQFRLWLIPF